MNNRFDELTKDLAQSVTRRTAFKRFGVGLAGMALAGFGLTNKATADADPFHRYGVCFKNCLRKRPTWTEYMCDEYCRGPIR